MADTHHHTGVGLPTILFIVFLILKLTGVIDWPWVWVTAPLWIPFCLFIGFLFIVCVFLFLAALVKK